ncbi:hypothetical protein [Methylovorus sp. MP688]|jgi:hypothetical protein|uniref:hypothetical protein n=1 Tax=Methylovorus sp. (strain MP688) TaxID=887061 RepID=UPI0001EC4F75|nr:hypothetical protein [Methylovorus sp. MP688]ADQ85723.1 conserved hypothetical protein [Methylovorus sp. MP688]
MKACKLFNPDKTRVRLASRKAVEMYFARCAANGINDCWLDIANRYRVAATNTYDRDLDKNRVDHSALIEYISASAPAHLIDGWSYLARASDAILRGDLSAAIHFSYYAELRAAMSLLACEGIGIFNQNHPLIDQSGFSTSPLKMIKGWNKKKKKFIQQRAGTHKAVWPLLYHWGSLKRAADLIEELVMPDGYSLQQWLNALHIPTPTRFISKEWLTTWGTDLTRLNEDHESRNMASYRPSEFRLPPAPNAPNAIEFISDLWRLLEPTAGGKFPQLEKELLKKIVSSSGKPITSADLQSNLGMAPSVASNWQAFLTSTVEPKPLVFSEECSDVDHADCAFQVSSRAALLLFLATGSTRKHLVNAGYSQEQLEFFWRRLCEVRFDGPASDLPNDPIDLWSDIEANLLDADAWRSTALPNTSLGEWRKAQPEVMNQIVSFELAVVWGLVS